MVKLRTISFAIALIVLCWSTAKGQSVCTYTAEELNLYECLTGYVNYKDNINASLVVDDMLSKVGLENSYFITKVCFGINNAVATIYNDRRYILLDAEWMDRLKYGADDWFHLHVIGHELAHHLLKHTLSRTSSNYEQRQRELEADEFSGILLGIYGASQSDIISLLYKLPDDYTPNSTHPRKSDREIAIRNGYNSSRNSEKSKLLNSLTNNVKLNLQSLPYLLSKARKEYNSFGTTGNRYNLKKGIEYYQEFLRFTDDAIVFSELARLFQLDLQRDKYNSTLQLAYEHSRHYEYILGLFLSHYDVEDYNAMESIISTYSSRINDINLESVDQLHTLDRLGIWYRYLALRDGHQNEINYNYLYKAKQAFKKGLYISQENGMNDTEDSLVVSDYMNNVGLCELAEGNYPDALDNFLAALHICAEINKPDSWIFEKYMHEYSNKRLRFSYNAALAYVRLREWHLGLEMIKSFEDYYYQLNPDEKNTLKDIGTTLEMIYYLKGRCLHGLKEFSEAVKYYTLAMPHEVNSNGFLNYYRGLSHLGLNHNILACNDFKTACEMNLWKACKRIDSTCK